MGEVVVIDTRYLTLDCSAEFTLKKETSWRPKGWSISGGDGNLVFRTENLVMERTRLLDATWKQVLWFEERGLPSGAWNVFSGTSESVLFRLKNSQILRFRTYMDVFLPSNSDTENPDYKIQYPERFVSSRFSILHGTQEVAVVWHHYYYLS